MLLCDRLKLNRTVSTVIFLFNLSKRLFPSDSLKIFLVDSRQMRSEDIIFVSDIIELGVKRGGFIIFGKVLFFERGGILIEKGNFSIQLVDERLLRLHEIFDAVRLIYFDYKDSVKLYTQK
jgi:hypothetical protein